MTPEQKKISLAGACANALLSCIHVEGCPICGVCASFANNTDEMACDLYAEAIKRGAIKEDT